MRETKLENSSWFGRKWHQRIEHFGRQSTLEVEGSCTRGSMVAECWSLKHLRLRSLTSLWFKFPLDHEVLWIGLGQLIYLSNSKAYCKDKLVQFTSIKAS